MQELEHATKAQFAKVFAVDDWPLFKEVAEFNFAEAATLKKSAFSHVPDQRKLLMRNVRKRLLIGIGTELLVKAIYLKRGYGINRAKDKDGPKPPYRLTEVDLPDLNPNDTFTLGTLLDHLKTVVQFEQPKVVTEGLTIARILRNKEGHVVTKSHGYDPTTYERVAAALVHVYSTVFAQDLEVTFSVGWGQKGIWDVAP